MPAAPPLDDFVDGDRLHGCGGAPSAGGGVLRRRPRVVHACLRYPPATGGVERHVGELVERARMRGDDVQVVTSRLRTHHPPRELEAAQLEPRADHVHRLPHASTPGLAYPRLRGLARRLSALEPDVVHGHFFWYHPADAAARLARRRRIPFVLHPYYYENRVRRSLRWRLYRRTVGWRTFRTADAVAVVSPQERERIERAGLPVRRFVLLPPGVDLARFAPTSRDPFRARGIEGRVLLAVGRISRGKRVAEAIDALGALLDAVPDARLAIVGEDFGERGALEKHAARLGLAGRVHFLGLLADDELAAAYRAASVLVHPSSDEAFGIVLAEAMAAGAPVVARRTGAVPWVVPDGEAGVLFDDPAGLVRALIRILGDPTWAMRLGAAGRARVESCFTWERSLGALDALHADLLASIRRELAVR